MKQYFFIPKHYENEIFNDLENYLSAAGAGTFTIITGVYKEFSGIVDNSLNKVYSKLQNGQIQTIRNNYEDSFSNKKYTIIGYCMEGNFQKNVPQLYAKIQTAPDCFIFDSANNYLNFINSL
jgi:hypothetical protein